MRIPQTVIATAAVVTTLVGMSVAGCSSHSKSPTPTSGSGAPTRAPIGDYTQLLIKASDINAPDAFTAGPATKNPNGQQGATITFTDQDHSHTIIDTIQILPDAEDADETPAAEPKPAKARTPAPDVVLHSLDELVEYFITAGKKGVAIT